jgi:hypothetical protein
MNLPAITPRPTNLRLARILGRVLCSSYIPKPGAPLHGVLVARLKAVFDEHQVDGRIQFLYETRVTFGTL